MADGRLRAPEFPGRSREASLVAHRDERTQLVDGDVVEHEPSRKLIVSSDISSIVLMRQATQIGRGNRPDRASPLTPHRQGSSFLATQSSVSTRKARPSPALSPPTTTK